MPRHLLPLLAASLVLGAARVPAAELHVGAAVVDITPTLPVGLDGQFHLRVARKADTPITANVVALESREGDRSLDAAVLVTCDVVVISDLMLEKVRGAVHRWLPDFDVTKLVLNATHTHTSPVSRPDVYQIPKDVLQPEAFCEFASERIGDAVAKAWNARGPGSFTWGLGHAAVAENRRAVSADGKATMYGNTAGPGFRALEGGSDHDVGTLFFWNAAGKLVAIVVNVSCPTQEVEGLSTLNADFWHPARESLRKRYGEEVAVLGWVGAGGDQSPHLMYRKAAEERMRTLRKLTRLEELARRIVAAVDETFDAVKDDRHAAVPLVHQVQTLELPMRLVTDEEYASVKAAIASETPAQMRRGWHQRVLDRYEQQKTTPRPTAATEIHVLRIGDVAVCTNPFELFTDFGIQIKARSRAAQTFVVQLVGGRSHGYVPTERAVRGGGYSAIIQSNIVGPQGGQMLVDETVKCVNQLWPAKGAP